MYYQEQNITCYLLFGFLSIIAITSCDTTSPDIEEPMWAQVNQTEWIADEIAYHGSISFVNNDTSSDHTIIYGLSSTNGRIVLYTTEPILSLGTYGILLKDSTIPSYYWPQGEGFESVFNAVSGEVVVSKFNNGEVSGSFKLTGRSEDGRKVVITDGQMENLGTNN